MTEAQERALKACREICLMLASEALIRIDTDLVLLRESKRKKTGHDRWEEDQQNSLLKLRRELEEARL